MTSSAIVLRRLLRLPVTVEAGGVTCRHSLECSACARLESSFRSANSNRCRRTLVRIVTCRAVVNGLQRIICERVERGAHEDWSVVATVSGNHALMNTVREVAWKLARNFALLWKRVHVMIGQARA